MRKWLFAFCFVFLWVPKSYAAEDIQQLIDNAKPGETITIPTGEYTGHFVIDKPLTLKGDGVFKADGQEPVLTIHQTRNVRIEGFTIVTNATAMEIKDAKNVSIENLHLEKVNAGVKVYNSTAIQAKDITITGREGHYSQKGNGLAFFKSHSIEVSHVKINNVQDGIYLEGVKNITLKNNDVTNGRYGVHFMYSEEGVAQSNHLEKNVTGFMVMMAKDVTLSENVLAKQRGLNSYGVVLYDVQRLRLKKNVLAENRTAISIQNSKSVTIVNNQFAMNETAVEAMQSDHSNVVAKNTFTGNILTARSDVNGVRLEGNYYDDYTGLDADDNGIGDTSYVALSSFGQWMVREPAYQYFVEAPAVTLLSTVDQQINRSSQGVLSDYSPLMVSAHMQSATTVNKGMAVGQLLLGLLFVFIGGFFWKRGIRS